MKVDQKWNSVKLESVRTLLKIICLVYRKSYLAIISHNSNEKLKLKLLFSPIWFYLPLFVPK